MFWLSPISVWSIGAVPLPEIDPVNNGCGLDHPFALEGSFDVRYENAVGPYTMSTMLTFANPTQPCVPIDGPGSRYSWVQSRTKSERRRLGSSCSATRFPSATSR